MADDRLIWREDAIKAVCQYCREGRSPEKNGDHVLAWIEGHVSHVERCAATAIYALEVADERQR